MPSVRVRCVPASAATVRHHITADLLAAGLPAERADDAALLASELVSNSIRHAQARVSGDLEVVWSLDATGVRLQVSDGGGATRPVPAAVGPTDTSGRGLAIVAALADDWGVTDRSDGATVWVHLPVPAV